MPETALNKKPPPEYSQNRSLYLLITGLRFPKAEPTKTSVIPESARTSISAKAVVGAVQVHHTECFTAGAPATTGSPVSKVAPRLEPLYVTLVPARAIAESKLSFGARVSAIRRRVNSEASAPETATS